MTGVLVLLPLAAASQTPAVERNVPYVTGGSADQRLDLTVPTASGFPTVIFIHGGSLKQSGERRSSPLYAHVCDPFVAAGIGCATIDYRLAPAFKWPAMPDDAAGAVKWVKTHIGAHGGDPHRLFLFGHSSGCRLAAILGTNPAYLGRVGLAPDDLAGVIAMGCTLTPTAEATTGHTMDELRARWPTSSFTDTYPTLQAWLDSDPSRFLGPHTPPTLVVVAHAERFFPAVLEQGATFVRRLLELKRPADLVLVPGRHYSSIEHITAPGDPTFAAVKQFIARPDAAGADSRH